MKALSRQTQFYLLVFFEFAVITATSMSLPYWPVILKASMGTVPNHLQSWNLIIYSAPLIATMIASPLWGNLADKFGYKKMVLRAALGLVLIQGGMFFVESPWLFGVLRFLQGVFCGYIAATQAMGVRMVNPERQTHVMSLLQSAVALSTLMGPLLGGVMLSYFNYHHLFFVSAIICLVGFIGVSVFIQEPKYTEEAKRSKQELPAATKRLTPKTKYLLNTVFLSQCARFMITPIMAFYVLDQLHTNQFSIGLLSAASGLALFLAAPLIGFLQTHRIEKNRSAYTLVLIALASASVLYFIQSLTGNFSKAFILQAFWGITLGATLPLLYAIALSENGEEIKGKVIGWLNSANKAGNLLGVFAGGLIYQYFGMQAALDSIAGLYLVTFLFLLKVRKNDTSPHSL